MTKEQILATSLYEQLAQEREQHQQQLSAEREAHKKEIERILSAVARGENLANSLNFDGKSELDKERERAGKLADAAKRVLASWTERMNGESEQFVTSEVTDRSYWSPVASQVDSKEINNLKQTLNEYEKEITGNQDHTNPSL